MQFDGVLARVAVRCAAIDRHGLIDRPSLTVVQASEHQLAIRYFRQRLAAVKCKNFSGDFGAAGTG